MKIFVGTLESGEGDFQACCAAIQAQKDVNITHVVISGRKEQEANRALFTEWNRVKRDFDLFLKVDADTVLANEGIANAFVQIFEADPELMAAQAWLQDYMTHGLIYGLTCIRDTVLIYPEKVGYPNCTIGVNSGHGLFLRGNDLPSALNPAGFHCYHSSEIQAFRYGIHRAKKQQDDILIRVKAAWLSEGRDKLRGLALLGFKLAPRCSEFDYSSAAFQDLYHEVQFEYDSLLASME